MTPSPTRPTRKLARPRGFTLIEIFVALGILGILAALSYWGYRSVINAARSRNFVGDFSTALSAGRMRAIAKQFPVMFVIDTSVPGQPAYYEIDDRTPPPQGPVLQTSAAIAAAAVNFTRSNAGYGLSGQNVIPLLLNEAHGQDTPVVMNSNAWRDTSNNNAPFPFPFALTSPNTTGGCSFCLNNRGAVAFLPDGRAVFSDASRSGAIVFIRQADTSPTATTKGTLRAVLISSTGHVEEIVQ